MTVYISVEKVAKLLNVTPRRVQQMCDSRGLPGARKVKGKWEIPTDSDVRLYRAGSRGQLTKNADLEGVPMNKIEDAAKKVGIVKEAEKLAADYVRSGSNWSVGIEVCATQNGIDRATLYRWRARLRKRGREGLIDRRGRPGGEVVRISDEAFEYFKAIYLDQRQPSIKLCWEITRHINKTEDRGWIVPGLRSMHRVVKEKIPYPALVLYREGMAAYEAKCAPYILNDPDSIAPGQVWVGDHHQLNCWIRHRGSWVRPWITAWQDMRSRMIVGWHFSVCPNQTTIMLAMRMAIKKYGPPDSVKIDNGKDYDSEMWTGTTKARRRARRVLKAGYIDEEALAGIYSMMDIGVSFAMKYHPQSKLIERWFDTFDTQFAKTLPTYCGKDSGRKPDYINDLLKSEQAVAEAYDLETFANLAGEYIEKQYNRSPHTGVGMEGRTPAEVMATREGHRVMLDGALELLMRVWSGELVVGKNGVKFKGMWYGQYDAKLMMYQGRKVKVSYDPAAVEKVYVYEAATLKLITIAEQAHLVLYGTSVSESALREAMANKRRSLRAVKDYRQSARIAHTDLASLAREAVIDAQQDRPIKEPQRKLQLKRIRPVKTALDEQLQNMRQ